MNYSIQQILTLFQDNGELSTRVSETNLDNEPKTPSFTGEKKQLLLKIEELKQQNLVLQQRYSKKVIAFSNKLNETSNLQVAMATVQSELQLQLKKTQLLTQEYLKKHDICFKLREQQINKKKQNVDFEEIGKRVTTCPSETSTIPSPSFIIPSSPKLVKLNCRSFTKNI